MNMAKLHALRKTKGYTQEQMAHKLGYKDKSSYCHIEKGNVKITLELLQKICEILEVDIKDIL
ncbi:MAG: helix-turn-helix transcriptional regulator [Clostridia bacterium]|jgi:DNA-binding XRE family transcriptional regulator|nr:helix-turn-helix transcriptional regulator [Clostridia bacterium]